MTTNNWVTFMTGVSCGLAAGVLFAPKSGAELRGRIADTVNDGQKAATETVKKTVGEVKNAIQSRVAVADHTIKEGVAAFNDASDVYLRS